MPVEITRPSGNLDGTGRNTIIQEDTSRDPGVMATELLDPTLTPVQRKRKEIELQIKKINGIITALKNAGAPSEAFQSVMVGMGAISAGATVVFPPVGVFLGLMTTLTKILESKDIFGTKRRRIESLKGQLEFETQRLKTLYGELALLTKDENEKAALAEAMKEEAAAGTMTGFLGVQDSKIWIALAGLLFLIFRSSKRKKRH